MGQAITFTVYGTPQPAGSKRAFVRPGMKAPVVVDANPGAKNWKNEVRSEAVKQYAGELLTGPLLARFVFFRPRPASHFGKNGLNAQGKRAEYPTSKPDVLKLARGVEDALTQVIYRDDAQIIDEQLVKVWGEPARVEVFIKEM